MKVSITNHRREYDMVKNQGGTLDRAAAEEFTSSLGQIVSGAWKLSLQAWKLGVPQALGMSHEEWVTNHLGGYVRLQIEERREVVAELTEGEGLSNRQAAEILGVDESTVRKDRAGNPADAPEKPSKEAGLPMDPAGNPADYTSDATAEDAEAAELALAPLNRAVDSFGLLGTVQHIQQATEEINDAVSRSGVAPTALVQIEEALAALTAAVEFAKVMAGGA